MKRICSFNEFMVLKEDSRTSGKTGLYPLGYGGIGLYPDADFMNKSADAAFYLSVDSRLFRNGDSAPFSIAHLPGHEQYGDKANSGENHPFDIRHLSGDVVPPKDTPLPDEGVPFKKWLKLVVNPTEISPPDSPNLPK